MKEKPQWNIFCVTVNANLRIRNVIQIKNEKIIIVNAIVRSWGSIICAKEIAFEVLLHVLGRLQHLINIVDDSTIICDEIVKLKHTVPINSNDKKVRYKLSYYIMHKVLLATVSLFIIISICFSA